MRKKRKCRKCGEIIPWWTTVDDQRKYLPNRKFCLNCSPFGSHNTRSDDPSIKPRNKRKYKDFSESQKDIHKARVLQKKYERKIKLIQLSGGECIICGYRKNIRCLSFHHRDPKKKKFGLNINTLGGNWESIIEEHSKCDLLCMNCHGEVESEKSSIDHTKFNEIIKNGIKNGDIVGGGIRLKKKKCGFCKKEFQPKASRIKFCSSVCGKKKQRKVKHPTLKKLQHLIDTTPMTTIGKMFGVSDNAVRKWCKKYKIIKKARK